MVLRILTDFLKFISTRVFVLYIGVCIFLVNVGDFNQALMNAKVRSLNRLRPDNVEYLIELKRGTITQDKKLTDRFLKYYGSVARYIPFRADAWGIYGYILSSLEGNDKKAIVAYRKAAEEQPRFFWFHYNLGILYLNNHQYDMAAESMMQAVQTSPEYALKYIFYSQRIYVPILLKQVPDARDSGNIQAKFNQQITEGYRQATKLLGFLFYEQARERFLNEDWEGAMTNLYKSLKILPDNNYAQYLLNVCLQKKKGGVVPAEVMEKFRQLSIEKMLPMPLELEIY